MGVKSHAVAFGVGYLLAQPAARRRLDQLLHQAVELSRPPARDLREGAWDAAGCALLAARNTVSRRRRMRKVDAAAVAAFGSSAPPNQDELHPTPPDG